jgi:hypothetical protein
VLILNPREVTFSGAAWPNVTVVAIDRKATRLAVSWSDNGPHPTFADAPEQDATVRVVMDVEREDIDGPRPGERGTLGFVTSPTASDASRRRVAVTCVVTGVAHELSFERGSVRTVNLIALSTNGAADPISIIEAAD